MIQSQLPGGTRHYEPAEMIYRNSMLHHFRTVFSEYGFAPLETPILQLESVLSGDNSDTAHNIFRIDDDERLTAKRALRFDLTVPLAQYVSEHSGHIILPFKRYEIGNVFRRETAQKGRYNQFIQCDFDTIGFDINSVYADAEIIATGYRALARAGIPPFTIKINNRKILNALPEIAQFDPLHIDRVIRILDKIDKIGDAVFIELAALMYNDGLALNQSSVDAIKNFITINTEPADAKIMKLRTLCINSNKGTAGIDEIESVFNYLQLLGIPETAYTLDISIARGLGYYTGIVFEATLNQLPKFGTIFAGGRYDNLISKFSNQPLSGVGGSIGIDRLCSALAELQLMPTQKTNTSVLVLNLDTSSARQDIYLNILSQLHKRSIASELYSGTEPDIRGQLGYASKLGIPYCIIIGTTECESGIALIKNMRARTQIEIALADISSYTFDTVTTE